MKKLAGAKVISPNLDATFYSPKVVGEEKRGWVMGIERIEKTDQITGEVKREDVVRFREDGENAKDLFIGQASFVRLITHLIKENKIKTGVDGTPIQTRYKGTVKNKSNNFESKLFEVFMLSTD